MGFEDPKTALMKLRLPYILILLLFLFSCRQNETGKRNEIEKYQHAISSLSDQQPSPKTIDSITAAWKELNSNPIVLADTALNAKTKYSLGRAYAKRNPDSSKLFLQQALELVDDNNNYLDIKARVYNGMGNLANDEAQEHQANYYYNKAAIIVLSDSTVELKPLAKVILLLSAAQSNKNLQQYSLAYKMNLAALKLMPQLPPNNSNQQRVLTQLISLVYTANLSDQAVAGYIKKLDRLHARYPNDFNPRYLYDSKLLYFDNINQVDSVLKYSLLNVEIDEQLHEESPEQLAVIGNLYTSYTNLLTNYTKLKDFTHAKVYLAKAQKLLQKNGKTMDYEDLIRGGTAFSSYYSAIGQPEKAYQASLAVIGLQRENFEIENTQAVAEMGALYQIQAKDNSINKLNEDIKLNHLKLQSNRLILLITALIALLLLIFFLLFLSINKQRKLKQEKENVQLQQQLLRTQMEPHFIFNTLSALQSFIRLDEKDEAIKYLNQFSRLLRSSLELSRAQLVPLNQEIETLENYLSLQQMRYNNIFRFNVFTPADEDLEMIAVPPMLIQPFVENAILHGINLQEKDSFVEVDFTMEDQLMVVKITDSGKSSIENKPKGHQSLSGIISKERLALLGKERNQQAGISEHKTPTGGTIITLKIPISAAS